MSAAPNVSWREPARVDSSWHGPSVVVGIALGFAWLVMRPMLTRFGLAVVAVVAAVPIAWAWRATARGMTGAREQHDGSDCGPSTTAPIHGRAERIASDVVTERLGGTPMIACAEQLISEYIDGDLPLATAREFEEHLARCADCRAILLEYCSLVAATHLLAARRHRTGDYGRSATEIRRRNGLGQARTSDLLA